MAGTFKGTIAPEEPFSPEHWLNSLEAAGLIVAGMQLLNQPTTVGMLDDIDNSVGKQVMNKADDTIVDELTKGMSKADDSLTSLYRAVGPDEFYDIMKTREFSVTPKGLQAKQFGFSFEETMKFADIYSDIGAIVEVKVPIRMLNKIGDFTQVDKFIFKNGTLTIQPDKLCEFNKIIKEVIHKY